MTEPLDSWYSDLSDDQRAIAHQLRDLVMTRQPQLREEIKWNQPCFYGKSMVCYIQKAKTQMTLGFGQGAQLADVDGILEGKGGQMRHVKLPLRNKINQGSLTRLIDQAADLDKVE